MITEPTALVVPIVSPSGELISRLSDQEITIRKPEGLVRITSNRPLKIKHMAQERTFNMVPGVEAIPISIEFSEGDNEAWLSIEVL